MRTRSVNNRSIGVVTWSVSMAIVVAAGCGSVVPTPAAGSSDKVINCTITRQECAVESSNASTCLTYAPAVTFTATACATASQDPTGACSAAYCAQPAGVQYPYQSPCTASGSDVTDAPGRSATLHPSVGICSTNTVPNGKRLALATFTQRWRNCVLATDQLSCSSFTTTPASGTAPPITQCVDLSTFAGNNLLKPPTAMGVRDGSELITSLVLDSPACPLVGDTSTATKSLTAGNIGTATGGGTSTPVSLTSGFATVGTFCDPLRTARLRSTACRRIWAT